MTRMLRPGFDWHVLTPVFAVMFRDRLDAHVVSEGLRVSLSDPALPNQAAQPLAANGYGVFVAHQVRGLHLPADPASPPPTRQYILQVEDPLGRYLPLRMLADLPTDGLFEPACLLRSPANAMPHVPLFSTSARMLPAACGEVRVDLGLDAADDTPAAWARLELRLDSDGSLLAEGLADARGSALLPFALPALVDPPLSASPPGPPLSTWPVRLHAFWNPAVAAEAIPDLCDLQALPEVPLLQTLAPSTPLAPALLVAGLPLVIRSTGSSFVFVGA